MIQNIIVMSNTGTPLFARSLMCNIGFRCLDLSRDSTFENDTILNSALLSAKLIYNYAEDTEFYIFELEKSKILTYPAEDTITILAVDQKDEFDEPMKNRLRLMNELFMQNFTDELQNLTGNIQKFSSFQNIIEEEGLLEEGQRFRANCINCKYDKACTFRLTIGPPERMWKERIESIKPMPFIKKAYYVFKGMFFTPFYT